MTNFEIAEQRINEAKRNNYRYLDLSGLGLSSIPEQIAELWQLCDVDLSFNQLLEFPSALIQLTNIRSLNISYNSLNSLPLILGNEYSLKELDISYNLFTTIPEELFYLNYIENIIFHNNPFLHDLPIEIKNNQDIFYVKFYLDSFTPDTETQRLFETKILIVGKGEVGKTTLMKVMRNHKFDVEVGKEDATHGINIEGYYEDLFFPAKEPYYNHFFDFEDLYYDQNGEGIHSDRSKFIRINDDIEDFNDFCSDDIEDDIARVRDPYLMDPYYFVKKEVKVNIWDFGGQEILYSTHQFFLTQRSIYVLVWEPRSDSYEENFNYWLNVIERLGKDSPVIIVMNKCDLSVKNIDEPRYFSEFRNIIGFYRISCLTKQGINRFMNRLMQGIVELETYGRSTTDDLG